MLSDFILNMHFSIKMESLLESLLLFIKELKYPLGSLLKI